MKCQSNKNDSNCITSQNSTKKIINSSIGESEDDNMSLKLASTDYRYNNNRNKIKTLLSLKLKNINNRKYSALPRVTLYVLYFTKI